MTCPGDATSIRWNHLYCALGLFAVLSTGTAVALSDVLRQRYAESVAVNQEWAERSARFARWGAIAAEGNAPGNDVFQSGAVEREAEALAAIVARFAEAEDEVLADLQDLDPDVAGPLRTEVLVVGQAFHRQVAEAEAIFRCFASEPVDLVLAGRHMADMDRYNALAARQIADLHRKVQGIQAWIFKEQLAVAARVRRYEVALIGAVALLALATVAYGRKLSRIFAASRARLEERNRDLARVLDNVHEGLVEVGRDGTMGREASAAFVHMLGPHEEGRPLWRLFEAGDPAAASALALGFEALRERALPDDVVVDQLPGRARLGQRTLSLTYRPIEWGRELTGLLVVVHDITADMARERREARQSEMLQLFGRVVHDRAGVEAFNAEASELVRAVVQGRGKLAPSVARRLLHTLKADAGFMGLERFGATCHGLEGGVEADGGLTDAAADALEAAWDDAARMLRHLLGDGARPVIEVEPEELEAALALAEELDTPFVSRALRAWQHERLGPRLTRIGDQAVALAERLGKEVAVEVDSELRRLDAGGLEPFWASLTHVLRNAIDHGIEPPDERVAAGKPAVGRVALRASHAGERFVLEVEDDGRGLDWDGIARAARAAGLPAASPADLQRALFHEGISTAPRLTDVSGRGMGTTVVAGVVQALGGRVSVRSTPAQGTCFRFELPVAA